MVESINEPTVSSDEPEVLTDSEDEDEFVRKYGDINFQYIKKPKDAVWFIRPHALNYFKDGVLYRTKGERTSSKTEMFLDLMYVGIISNLAGEACEDPSGLALVKYILLFAPAWQVWSDIKDFTNYYYNEDLSQKLYIFWILCLLTLYINSHDRVWQNRSGAVLTVVPYILCRLSLAVSLVVYTFFIPEHRFQQRFYAATIVVNCALWVIVIFVRNRVKVALAVVFIFFEQVSYFTAFHPWFKRKFGLTMSTAINIEHEVERYTVFVTIAIGEFLYKVVASNPLGAGFSSKYARGIFLIWIAYVSFWLYNYGSTSKKATHALRHSGWTASMWIYAHFPLAAALVLAADAGGDLVAMELEHPDKVYGLTFFFTGGLGVSLVCMCVLGLLDVSRDPPNLHIIPKFWRIIWRAPIGAGIACLSFAKLDPTLLMGIIVALYTVLLCFESVTSTPRNCLRFAQ